MGCGGSKTDSADQDRLVLQNFLDNKASLKDIWDQFNKDGNDIIDREEFEMIIFSALQLFANKREPTVVYDRQKLDPFVKEVVKQLTPRIDSDGDGTVSFDEFEPFGEYLKSEYKKIQEQIAQDQREANDDDDDEDE
mmetsp:Transcript_24260/g.29645  ORF Transcript_24260/g.29645 Transcript_24260/m.29645 type:complete len:137 (+) Transcript_24260:38-448(+)|eukprot:CAMPEP_0114665810 /NCGR_PEP_ID=MMETSP0191-20121206/31484_1 /TAXON_ID=126664 /ORGANISM="Sorites sp." /LENGTH=136 /DNA_ID=CAMNT_0001911933 /DNA_START=85 /DNA_END=495 /DNA_ORIENTATION=-